MAFTSPDVGKKEWLADGFADEEKESSKSAISLDPAQHERALEAVAIQATTAFLASEISYKLLSKVKRVLVEDYYVFLDALKIVPMLSLSDPNVLALLNNMKKQRDKIWDLGETVDHIRPSLVRGMRQMFPANPPEYGVDTYTVRTGEQHPLNSQLLQEFDNIHHTYWRKGPSKEICPTGPATTSTTMPTKRRGPPLRAATAKKMKRLLKRGLLTPPAASCELSESDDQDNEMTVEEDDSGNEFGEEEHMELKKETAEGTAEKTV